MNLQCHKNKIKVRKHQYVMQVFNEHIYVTFLSDLVGVHK